MTTEEVTGPTMTLVRARRDLLVARARARRLEDVRVFGSVARGDQRSGSDVDLLVRPGPDASLFDLAGFQIEAAEILGHRVDVVSDRGTGPTMDRIRAEALPL